MFNQLLSALISRVRGVPFVLDPDIPGGYLLRIVTTYATRRLRGMLLFPGRSAGVFVGARCTLLGRSRIVTQGALNVGDGCILNAVSRHGIRFGANVSVQRGVVIECSGSLQHLGHGVQIGRNVGIGTGSFLGAAGGIVIGDETIIGNCVSFHSENHHFADREVPIRLQGTHSEGIEVGGDCWVGAKAIILDGARIGRGSVVAAGAVVRSGIYPEYSILGGVPARVIGQRGSGDLP